MGALSGVRLHLIEDMSDAQRFWEWLNNDRGREVLGVDTETTGLNRQKDRIRLIQFGDEREGWAIPWDDWRGLAMQTLQEWRGGFVAHNSAFDGAFLAREGWLWPRERTFDTMLMAHVVNPLGSGALKPLSTRLVDPRANSGQHLLDDAMKEHGWGWGDVPVKLPAYWNYSALDPVLTCLLYRQFIDQCKPEGVYGRVFALEMAARHVVSAMERRGAPVDVEYAVRKRGELEYYAENVKAWLKEWFQIEKAGSLPQLRDTFLGLGATIERTTDSGALAMDKWQLRILAADPDPMISQLASQLLSLRKAEKQANAYFKNFAEMSVDGIVHPEIRTLGARTGRMSVANPALQQVPKGDKTVRRTFLPTEGNALVCVDYNQIEMRLMAHFSSDVDLVNTFISSDESGGDFFVEIGKQVYGEPDFDKDDPRRNLIKSTMYGKIYGAGVSKMAETAGVRVDSMRAVVNALDSRYPGIKQLTDKIEDTGIRRERSEGQAYVVTPFGRRLPCDSGHVYALTNYLHQSHAAEIFKEALVRLDAAGWSDAMMLPVHDEIVLDVPHADVEQAMREVPQIMGMSEGYHVPLTADAEGPFPDWGAKVKEKKKK